MKIFTVHMMLDCQHLTLICSHANSDVSVFEKLRF